jgi:sugar transferase EpsL
MKRFFDVTISLLMIILLAPIIIAISVLILIKIGAPVLFIQVRPGLNSRPFKMYKFRSMLSVTEAKERLIHDSERLTSFGRLLRSTSLDELPGLWNVLRGEMSLVGPRPLLMQYLPLYTAEQTRRHEVRPGVTGWAQVNGRNAITWEEKFKLDVWYVDNQTLWLDAKILWLTVKKVVVRDGISAEGEATMPAFTGSKVINANEYSE